MLLTTPSQFKSSRKRHRIKLDSATEVMLVSPTKADIERLDAIQPTGDGDAMLLALGEVFAGLICKPNGDLVFRSAEQLSESLSLEQVMIIANKLGDVIDPTPIKKAKRKNSKRTKRKRSR